MEAESEQPPGQRGKSWLLTGPPTRADTGWVPQQSSGLRTTPKSQTNQDNCVKQIGSYRFLFRQSAKMNQSDTTRGFNPQDQAYDFVHTPKSGDKIGKFFSATTTGTQGEKIAGSLSKHLRATNKTT